MNRRPRVLVADDHGIVVDGLRRILDPEFEIVGTASNGRALIEQARRLHPDVIVADIAMPELNGLDAFLALRRSGSRAKVVFLTGNPDVTLATQAVRHGAAGYVLKDSAGQELITAIRDVLAGRTFLTSRIAGDVLQNLMEGRGKAANPIDELTRREREVLQLLAEGRSTKEAAAVLNISPRTVEFHKENLQLKTGLRTIAELARYAARHGLVAS